VRLATKTLTFIHGRDSSMMTIKLLILPLPINTLEGNYRTRLLRTQTALSIGRYTFKDASQNGWQSPTKQGKGREQTNHHVSPLPCRNPGYLSSRGYLPREDQDHLFQMSCCHKSTLLLILYKTKRSRTMIYAINSQDPDSKILEGKARDI
jgi:hypothetical protein